MYCRQVQSHLDDYILNQVDDQLIDQIENHLKECLDCQKQLKTNKQLITALKSVTTPDPGEYYWQQMEDSILTRALDENEDISNPPVLVEIGPVGIVQRYLIPLAAVFVLFFGSIIFSNSLLNPNQSVINLTGNSTQISGNSDSQLFTAIVASAPGSLGRHLVLANISGANGGSR